MLKGIRRGRSLSPFRVSIKGNKTKANEAEMMTCPYCDKSCKGSRGVNVHLKSCKLIPKDPLMNEWLIKRTQRRSRARSWSGVDSWVAKDGSKKNFVRTDQLMDVSICVKSEERILEPSPMLAVENQHVTLCRPKIAQKLLCRFMRQISQRPLDLSKG